MGWADLSHRISYLNVSLDASSGDANMGLIGGDWSTGEEFSDTIFYRMGGAKVSTDRAGFAYGEISLVIEPSVDGSEFTANGTASVPYSEIGDWPNYVALISGFGMWTDVEQLSDNCLLYTSDAADE